MPTTNAVAYCRVSTEGQAEDGVSLEAQEQRLIAYARAFDIELVEIIRDVESAKSLVRPGLERALGLLDCGAANAILVPKLDLLSLELGREIADSDAHFIDGAVEPHLLIGEVVVVVEAHSRIEEILNQEPCPVRVTAKPYLVTREDDVELALARRVQHRSRGP